MTKPEEAAARGKHFIELYQAETGSDEFALQDLLTDLMHWYDTVPEEKRPWGGFDGGDSFPEVVAAAAIHHRDEKAGQ